LYEILFQSGNFANPVYDSLYSVGPAGSTTANFSEEKKGLLQQPNKDGQHPLGDTRDGL